MSSSADAEPSALGDRAGEAEAATSIVPKRVYADRVARFTAERDAFARRATVVSNIRGVLFLALIGAGLLSEARPGPLSLALAIAVLATFVLFVIQHGRLRARRERAERMRVLNQAGLDRLARNWDALPATSSAPPSHRYAADLDVYGHASIMRLLGPTVTPPGVTMLRRWLLGEDLVGDERPDAEQLVEEIRARQRSVRALAPSIDARQDLARIAQDAIATSQDLAAFFDWAETELEGPSTALRAVAIALPVTLGALVGIAVFGGPDRLWLAPILVAGWLTFGRVGSRLRREFERAFGREDVFRAYPELFALAESSGMIAQAVAEGESPAPVGATGADARAAGAGVARAGGTRSREVANATPASVGLRELYGIMQLADVRHSSWLYPLLALSTMWDVHIMARLARWRREHGAEVRMWFDALGSVEALCALASLAFEHPDWCFAEVNVENGTIYRGEALGHPLLLPRERVDNDVEVGPPGTFLFITGSNMSGKSTLLRAIGTNAVLAYAGAPSCARQLSLPMLDVRTSIRIEDSLERGVSLFMAELERLKSIVDAASSAGTGGGATRHNHSGVPVLYLFDEVLHGTNTAERRIAAARVLQHLLDAGAIGAITTHDLELAGDPAVRGAAHPVHFRETMSGGGTGPLISFDYKLRPGIATTTNALALLRQMGLE